MSILFTRRPVFLAAFLAASLARAVVAQDVATTVEQLRQLVKAGDRVTVIDNSGEVVKGRVIDLSPTTLNLQTNRLNFELPIADVHTISQERHLNIGAGAAWGFGVAAGWATLLTLPAWNSGCRYCASTLGGAILMTGGIGAGIGGVRMSLRF